MAQAFACTRTNPFSSAQVKYLEMRNGSTLLTNTTTIRANDPTIRANTTTLRANTTALRANTTTILLYAVETP